MINKKHFLFITLPMSILCTFLAGTATINAQISEGGLPPSFSYQNTLKSTLAAVEMPVDFSVEDLKAVDEWKVSQGAPLCVAKLIDTDLDIIEDGNRLTLPDGQEIWQLRIQAENAIAIMLYYDRFYIPEGGKLFIYNAAKSQVLGAYTTATNPPARKFATEFIAGDDIILEYVAASSNEQPRIHIESVGYGYNHLYITGTSSLKSTSTDCMVNINCEEGDAWQAEKEGVCKMIQRIGRSSYLCSGSLVNNTKEDLTPYILSAFHCSQADPDQQAGKDDYDQWMFYFGYERTQCSSLSIAYKPNTMTGCVKVAATPISNGSDGLLLKLNQSIPDSYNVYYNGWDRSDTPAQSGVGIHHPNGDYKKISTFRSPVVSTTWLDVNSIKGYRGAHWNAVFEATPNGHSVTAGGSSGSPLFNQNKLIVGTLTGGDSECENNPDGSNIYGKFSYHWNKFPAADTTRMDIWLDPINKGVMQLNGRYAAQSKLSPTDLTLTYGNQAVTLKWTAPAASDIEKYAVYRNNTLIDHTTSTTYADRSFGTGSQTYGVSALYRDGKESGTTNATIFITDYKAPTHVTANNTSDNTVLVSWKAPLYQQTILWGDGNPYLTVGLKGTPFYFGQTWDAADLASIHNKKLTAVSFRPNVGTYSILIFQGNMENKYEQKISNPVYKQTNTVTLKTPYVINATKPLYVVIYAENYKETEYPAYIDKGPAISGKGNVFSRDGKKWEYLYVPEGGGSTPIDGNFTIAAIVTSEEGTLPKSGLRSSEVAAFPKITGYNVYRDKTKLNRSFITDTEYLDKNVLPGNHVYSVSAVYNENNESLPANAENEVIVSIEDINNNITGIAPLLFGEQVRVNNAGDITLLEIVSADGRIIKSLNNPEEVIYTGSFAPGIYIFRLHTKNGIKVIQAAKQ